MGRAPLARTELALLALCCVPIFFWGLGRYGVVNADEAFYQAVSERMVASGDWLRLDFRGEPRFYDSFLNAPLSYWIRAALISLFGSNAWTMRGLSALAGAGTVLVTAWLAARVAGRRAALFAGGVLLLSFQFVFLHGARTGELDALVSLEFVAIAWLFLRAVEDGTSFVPHHLVLCALGWTKTPLVLIPLGVELLWFARARAARPRWRAYWQSGLALAPVALAWHVVQLAIWWDRVPAIAGNFLDQASGAKPDGEYHGRLDNGLFYLRALAWGAFPWSAVWPFALLAAWRAPRVRPLLAWPVALLVFFTLVAKHYAWYVLPLYPFLAIAVGAWLAEPRPLGAPLAAAALVGALLCLDATPANPFGEAALAYPMRFAPSPLAAWALPLAILAGVGLWRLRRNGAVIALAALLFLPALLRTRVAFAHLDHRSPLVELHAELARARAEGREIAYPVRLPDGPVQIARFLFAEDYEIEVRPNGLWLQRKGDPAVLGRSIGRLGLEQRLGRPD
jgi:4-amino-4-deoxy-L-arabinose transferase-like glycosyltransferase